MTARESKNPDASSSDPMVADEELSTAADAEGAEEKPQRLELEVGVEVRSSCERRVKVTIPRADIDRYQEEAFSELMDEADVPGFRRGRAPRKLVEARFRKEVLQQVKGKLLLDSMGQVTAEQKLAAISEPDFDPTAVEIPEEGPLTYEFKLEVRPEFDLPEWKGLAVTRPVHAFTPQEVEARLKEILAERGRLVPFDGPAADGDYVTANITFQDGDAVISQASEAVIRVRPRLSLRDGKVENFDKLMSGVRAGETRRGTARLSQDAPNAALRGKEIAAVFEVLEVKKLELPELTPALLEELGEFQSADELRTAVAGSLERKLEYEQQRRAREQVLAALTRTADWDLPPDLLRRQSKRELERAVLELQRSGFSEAEVRAHENELRQNSQAATARALKEHFILEKLAEAEGITDEEGDYDAEIALIAMQSGESARRVRAQLEKRGLMDTLRNQIVERKSIALVLQHATFKEMPYRLEASETESLDRAAGGGDEEESAIPEAKHAGEAAPLPGSSTPTG